MPTHDEFESFWRDFDRLTGQQQRAFLAARSAFVSDLRAGAHFRPSLRVKRVHGHSGTWELTWAPDGRATFEYGPEVRSGDPHIIWRRIGSHEILDRP